MAKKKYNKSRRDLFCWGCVSSEGDIGFPGRPGHDGQYAECQMCMRNPDVQERLLVQEPLASTTFSDGSPPVNGLPADLYCTQDMLDQFQFWLDRAVEEATKSQTRKDISAIAREYGVDLPEHEVPN